MKEMPMRNGLIAVGAWCVGLAVGFFFGRQTPLPAASARVAPHALLPELLEQSAALKIVNGNGTFDIYYARPFASPPALEVIDDNVDPKDPRNLTWAFRVTEQRAEGFKMHVTTGGGTLNETPLRYVAKGIPFDGTLAVQTGTADVPFGRKVDGKHQAGVLDVFYLRPFDSPPHLTFPLGTDGCRVLDQKANGFRLERDAEAGSKMEFKWRAELITGK